MCETNLRSTKDLKKINNMFLFLNLHTTNKLFIII
ncbi:hypothetical protein HMPREF1033_00820 [Tannerella sp. 6_1_58FAA_CT1]|nr:hypothetical protein HMPREF1033_00820 [Tannerella sp. 6_1_58FAA_CT1]